MYENLDAMRNRPGGWDYNVHFVRSRDMFQSDHEMILKCGNSFEVLNGDMYVAALRDCEDYYGASSAGRAKFASVRRCRLTSG